MSVVLALHDLVRNEFSDLLTTFFNENSTKRKELEMNRKKYLKLIRKRRPCFVFDPPELGKDEDLALRAVKIDGCIIRRFSSIVNERIALAAIKNNPKATIYLKEDFLCQHRDFTLMALRLTAPNFCYNYTRSILLHFRKDREIVLAVAGQHINHDLPMYCEEWLNDREIAARAVTSNYNIWPHVGVALRNDRNFIQEMIRATKGSVFHLIGDRYLNDREMVELAVGTNSATFPYVGSEIKKDRAFVMELLERKYDKLGNYVVQSYMEDREMVMKCIENAPYLYYSLSPQMRQDREISMECMKGYPYSFYFSTFAFPKDKEMAFMYLRVNPQGFPNICQELRADREVVEFVLESCPDLALKYGLVQDAEIVMKAVKRDWKLLNVATYQDRDIVLEAMKQCPVAGLLANKEVRMDTDVLKEIVMNGMLDFLLTLQQYDL